MENQYEILKNYFSLIHKIISRGINISLKGGQDIIGGTVFDDNIIRGYLSYVRMTGLMLDTHHRTEDDIAFPYFKESLPDTHFLWLREDHDLITGFLEALSLIMDVLESGSLTLENFEILNQVLLKIEDRWTQHIELEEEEFIDLIDSLAPPDARKYLVVQFFQYNEPLLEPYYLSFPFMLFNLKASDRQHWSENLSTQILQKIETAPWKEKWSPMAPYLFGE